MLYERSLPLDEALRDDVLLAYAMNGEPLPPQHGYPLRLLVPGWYGMTHVKWLRTITVVGEQFRGWQQADAYRIQRSEDDAATPVTRMLPRSLLVPPGIPDFLGARAVPRRRAVLLEGRAWSGWADRARRGERRRRRDVGRRGARRCRLAVRRGRGWRFEWDAVPGEHELCCRATRRRREHAAARAGVEPRRLLQQRGAARRRDRQLTASAITNTANATLITPFIVKNAALSRRRSSGATSECS